MLKKIRSIKNNITSNLNKVKNKVKNKVNKVKKKTIKKIVFIYFLSSIILIQLVDYSPNLLGINFNSKLKNSINTSETDKKNKQLFIPTENSPCPDYFYKRFKPRLTRVVDGNKIFSPQLFYFFFEGKL